LNGITASLLYVIVKEQSGFDLAKGFATNGFRNIRGALTPHLGSAYASRDDDVFLFVIRGSRHGKTPA
jgi:aquaporin Z